MEHTLAIGVLKKEINRLVERIVQIETEIRPLLDEKTELELMSKEIETSLVKLVHLNGDMENVQPQN